METTTKKPRVVYAITPARTDRDGKVTMKEGEGFWKEVGSAFTNADDSITIHLDAMPVNGKLQIRDRLMKGEVRASDSFGGGR